MGKYFDFAIKHDSEKESERDLTKKILYSLITKRIKGHKPVVIFLGGDSGEGKSYSALALQELLLEMEGLALINYVEPINVYLPIEYPQKLDALLFNKELKHINILCVHEARDVVRSKDWYKFVSQAIADVNAQSRSIKRLCFIIISQFIRDITADVRYTLTYYITADRPIGQKTRLKINVMWKDDSDLEKPKLRKRTLRGYLIDNKGRYKIYIPKYLEITKPNKAVLEEFENRERASKSKLIRQKLEKLIQELKIDEEVSNRKVIAIAKFYSQNPNNLHLIGQRYRNKFRVKPQVKLMHDLTDVEVKELQEKLNEELNNQKLMKVTDGEE